jgi:hypothetical protein
MPIHSPDTTKMKRGARTEGGGGDCTCDAHSIRKKACLNDDDERGVCERTWMWSWVWVKIKVKMCVKKGVSPVVKTTTRKEDKEEIENATQRNVTPCPHDTKERDKPRKKEGKKAKKKKRSKTQKLAQIQKIS